jgi:hypothetical protein
MGGRQPAHRRQERSDHMRGMYRTALDPSGKRLADESLHDHEEEIAVTTHIEDFDDVRVVYSGRGLRLHEEALNGRRVHG